MQNNVIHSAEEYLAFHELDLQNSSDLSGLKVIEASIPNEAVKQTRQALGLTMEMMAILLGVNLASMVRYENISIPPYPQGPVARKMGLLINWMADAKSRTDILNLLGKENGLATLSGLLQTESVVTYLTLSAMTAMQAESKAPIAEGGFGGNSIIGNA